MNLDVTNDRALTVAQAAEFLGVSESVVLDLISSSKLDASNIGRGTQRPRWRILASDLGKYLVRTRMPAQCGEQTAPKKIVPRASKNYFGD